MELSLAEALAAMTTGIYVLTVRSGDLQHGMSSSWATQVSGQPVLVMAAVDQQHVTHRLLLDSHAFALNIVGVQSAHLEDYFYSVQSRRPDNLTPFALETGITGAPLLHDALASLECRLVSTHPAGDHTLFIGEVVAARVRVIDRPVTSRDLPYVYLGGKVLFDQVHRRPMGSG
jgi:flavin reductase (DIM6/NTAB) family NADH-FMN oxidoreductase RutF